jgi:hypothetical protein
MERQGLKYVFFFQCFKNLLKLELIIVFFKNKKNSGFIQNGGNLFEIGALGPKSLRNP